MPLCTFERPAEWLDPAVRPYVLAQSDAKGLQYQPWRPGVAGLTPPPLPAPHIVQGSLAAILNKALDAKALSHCHGGADRRCRRSEERRVGTECVSTCRSGWSRDH